jgi:hypothetical protein
MRVSFVDVAYRGLKVAQKARWQESEDGKAFLEHEAPLPVGARLDVTDEGSTRVAVVVGVVEQEAGAKSPPGMRLAWADALAAAVPPPPAAPEPDAPAPVPIETDKTLPVDTEMLEITDPNSGGIVVEEQGEDVSGKATAAGKGKKRGRRKTQNGRVS